MRIILRQEVEMLFYYFCIINLKKYAPVLHTRRFRKFDTA